MHVDAEGPVAEVGQRVRRQFPGGGRRLPFGQARRHTGQLLTRPARRAGECPRKGRGGSAGGRGSSCGSRSPGVGCGVSLRHAGAAAPVPKSTPTTPCGGFPAGVEIALRQRLRPTASARPAVENSSRSGRFAVFRDRLGPRSDHLLELRFGSRSGLAPGHPLRGFAPRHTDLRVGEHRLRSALDAGSGRASEGPRRLILSGALHLSTPGCCGGRQARHRLIAEPSPIRPRPLPQRAAGHHLGDRDTA